MLDLTIEIKHAVHRVAADNSLKALCLFNLLTGPDRTGPASLGKVLIVTEEISKSSAASSTSSSHRWAELILP